MDTHKRLTHEQAAELLPWLVNGSLEADQREDVLAHAMGCVICRRDMDELERFSHSVAMAVEAMPIPAPDMRNINTRIDGLIDRQNSRWRWVSRLRDVVFSPWRLAFAVQTVLIIVLAAALFSQGSEAPEFTTLTQPPALADGHYLRVVFSPDLEASKFAGLLEKRQLTVADGPSESGVYTLAMLRTLTDDERFRLLEGLRSDPNVLFAQPVIIGKGR